MERASVYLVYAALVVITFLCDRWMGHENKKIRTTAFAIAIIGDLAILAYGLYLYLEHQMDQTGFILGSILFIICILCLMGRVWQNRESDRRKKSEADKE